MSIAETIPPVAETILDCYLVLEGHDSYTMGDPGGCSTTGDTRQALAQLLKHYGVDPFPEYDRDDPEARRASAALDAQRRTHSEEPIEQKFERLSRLTQAADEQRWLTALAALPQADQPLASLATADSKALVSSAYSLLNSLGHRRNTLNDIARNLVLCDKLRTIATTITDPKAAKTLTHYAQELELNTRRYVLWNELEIGIDPGPYYIYVGADERRRDDQLLAADFKLPYETVQSDWQLVSS